MELLALVSAAKHFHHYIVGSRCIVRTDHSALTWLKSFRRVEGQLARWIETLQNYQLEIEYRPGRVHKNADALSRQTCGNRCVFCRPTQSQTILTVSAQPDWENAQRQDPPINWIRTHVVSGKKPEWNAVSGLCNEAKTYWNQFESLCVENNVLFRKTDKDGQEIKQLVVPYDMRDNVLFSLHGNQVHVGSPRTISLLKDRFYWPRWRTSVHDFIVRCLRCRHANGPSNNRKQCLAKYLTGAPFARIAIDHYGPLTQTDRGN